MNESGGTRLNLLLFWCVIGGLLIGAHGIYGLVHYTRDGRSSCLGCHEETPGTKGLWDISPLHSKGIVCSQCHSGPGGYLSARFSAHIDTVNPNCMACHQQVLEGTVSERNVSVRGTRRDTNQTAETVLYQWSLRDLMFTWHVQKRVCVCTDCHRNVSHDKRSGPERYRPQMTYCAECHYHAVKDEYARMRPLPEIAVEDRKESRRR